MCTPTAASRNRINIPNCDCLIHGPQWDAGDAAFDLRVRLADLLTSVGAMPSPQELVSY